MPAHMTVKARRSKPDYRAAVVAVCAALDREAPETEYRFHDTRKWRFDFAWPLFKVAVEVNGGAFVQGRHTRGIGAVKDWEKLNTAQLAGWTVLQITPRQVTDGTLAALLREAL